MANSAVIADTQLPFTLEPLEWLIAPVKWFSIIHDGKRERINYWKKLHSNECFSTKLLQILVS